jgi:putative ABC transport system ATP-binding protein
MPETLIHLESVDKIFVTDDVETHALSNIQLDVNRGDYISIAGPSGCGKSTLLAILGLLDAPSNGTYVLNVELPLTYRGMSSTERKKRSKEALERVGMSHRTKHYPSQLSGGQQQRVAVARALGGDPAILLADEPTGNLDSANGQAVMDLLKELHQNGATICMVTHDQRYAAHADRSVHLFDGKVVENNSAAA